MDLNYYISRFKSVEGIGDNLAWDVSLGALAYVRGLPGNVKFPAKSVEGVKSLNELYNNLMVQELYILIDDSNNVLVLQAANLDKYDSGFLSEVTKNIVGYLTDYDILQQVADAEWSELYSWLHVSFTVCNSYALPVFWRIEQEGDIEPEAEVDGFWSTDKGFLCISSESIRDAFGTLKKAVTTLSAEEQDTSYVQYVPVAFSTQYCMENSTCLFVYNRNHYSKATGSIAADEALKSVIAWVYPKILVGLAGTNYKDTLGNWFTEIVHDSFSITKESLISYGMNDDDDLRPHIAGAFDEKKTGNVDAENPLMLAAALPGNVIE